MWGLCHSRAPAVECPPCVVYPPNMSFFDRHRRNLEKRGLDPDRLPPGQYLTERFPVLQAGPIPDVDLATWDFVIDGLVGETIRLDWEGIQSIGRHELTTDIHCVTKWSKFDTKWSGIRTRDIWNLIDVAPEATHVLVNAYQGYSANLPIEDFLSEDAMFADTFDGEPLTREHGYPMRLVVPHLYFWKSVKWVRGFTVMSQDEPGYWERNGYHMYADPFKEQRFWSD